MNGFLLDTMAVSEGAKRRPNPGLARWLGSIDESATYISVLTVGEIQKGISRLDTEASRRVELERWLTFDLIGRFGRRILDFDTSVARHWGTLVASALARRLNLSILDSQIAATASLYGLSLVTRNVRHFIPTGVDTLDPWSDV